MTIMEGTRILITKSQTDFFLGTVMNVIADQAFICLDSRPFEDATKYLKLRTNLLLPVNYWRLQTPRTKYDSIEHDEYDPHRYFLKKSNVNFDMALARASWAWTNAKLFDYGLHKYPKLQDKIPNVSNYKRGTLWGLFESHPYPTISLSRQKLITPHLMFQTMVHEMVHQYTWEKHNIVDHGRYFLEWQEAVKSVCSVPLRVNGDMDDKEVEFEKKDLEQEDDKEVYVLMLLDKSIFWAVASNNLDILENVRDRFSTGHQQTYLRKIRNEKIRGTLKILTKIPTKVRQWQALHETMAELIIKEGQAVYSKILHVA